MTLQWTISARPAGSAGDRAEHAGEDRHVAHRLDRGDEVGTAVGQISRAHRLGRTDVGSGAVDQEDQRHAVFDRQVLAESSETTLGALHGEHGRAALDGEVFAADCDRPAVDLAQAHDVGGRGEVDQFALVVLSQSGQRADLVE